MHRDISRMMVWAVAGLACIWAGRFGPAAETVLAAQAVLAPQAVLAAEPAVAAAPNADGAPRAAASAHARETGSTQVAALLATLRAVGPHAAGHPQATAAWAELARQPAARLPQLLAGLEGANPLAANWIRTAIDAVAERQLAAGQPLPAAELERFVRDRSHDPRARRLAYELLLRVDPGAKERIIPHMLDDPSAEMRRDAVARLVDQAQVRVAAQDQAGALALYRQALASARDIEQVAAIAERLRKLGHPVDLARQLGYILRWKVIGPFDNTGGRGFDQVYPPEKEFHPDAVYQGKHGPVRWKDYTSRDDYGTVDFNQALGEEKAVVGYALTEFVADRRQEVEIRMTSYNAPKLWVNGKLVAQYPVYHSGGQADQYLHRVVLEPGSNRILVKACQNELTADWAREWAFRLRVCDASGAAVLSTDRLPAAPGDNGPSDRDKPAKSALRLLVPFPVACATPASASFPLFLAPWLLAPSDWRHFRGTQQTGEADAIGLPVSFGPDKNVAWKVPLPGPGPASPIVVQGLVIVTAASGPRQDRLHVLAFDAAHGRLRWHRQLWATGHVIFNPFGGVAAPTPSSDGRRVVALFSSNDLVCFDLDGNLQWLRGLALESPMTRNDVGMASSPLIVGDTVVAQLECPGESFATGLDLADGHTRWRVPREAGGCWTSPTLLAGNTPAEDLVLLQSRSELTAHEPRTGRQMWRFEAACSTVSSLVVADDTIFLPADGITALRFDRQTRQVKVLWQQPALRCVNASPVVHAGRIYTIKSPAILVCGEAQTGKILWQLRLRGSIWATPAIAGGYLYAVSHEGTVQVVRLDERGQLAGSGELDAPVLASPAVADGAIYFRTKATLWKIAEGRGRPDTTQ